MINLAGHVIDEKTKIPIHNATIKAEVFDEDFKDTITLKSMDIDADELPAPDPDVDYNQTSYEAKSDENGYYELEIPKGEYHISFSADDYRYQRKDMKLKKNTKINAELTSMNLGTLDGKVHVTNLNGISIGGLRVKISRDGEKIFQTPVNKDGEYSFDGLTSGDYTLSIIEPTKHFLKDSEIKVKIGTKDDERESNTRDIPVEILTIPKAILGLTKKKRWLIGGGGGQVVEGHCKLATIDPSDTSKTIIHSVVSPDITKDEKFGRFEFNDLVPGIYAVTFFKPHAEKELKKYSKMFQIGKKELEKYADKPFPINGKKGGKDVLQKSWTDMKEVKDEIEMIAEMTKSLTEILESFGLKAAL